MFSTSHDVMSFGKLKIVLAAPQCTNRSIEPKNSELLQAPPIIDHKVQKAKLLKNKIRVNLRR